MATAAGGVRGAPEATPPDAGAGAAQAGRGRAETRGSGEGCASTLLTKAGSLAGFLTPWPRTTT